MSDSIEDSNLNVETPTANLITAKGLIAKLQEVTEDSVVIVMDWRMNGYYAGNDEDGNPHGIYSEYELIPVKPGEWGEHQELPLFVLSISNENDYDHMCNRLKIWKDFEDYANEHIDWSLKTFTHATSKSALMKLREELEEVEQCIDNGEDPTEEYVDVLMCMLSSMCRANVTVEQLFEKFTDKLQINQSRNWERNDDNTYKHTD